MTEEMSDKWLGIWYGFVKDLMDEWGFVELRDKARKHIATDPQAQVLVLEFLEKLEILNLVVDLMADSTRILSSPWKKTDTEDIRKLAGMLKKFGPSHAVEKLKTAIREFLRETTRLNR